MFLKTGPILQHAMGSLSTGDVRSASCKRATRRRPKQQVSTLSLRSLEAEHSAAAFQDEELSQVENAKIGKLLLEVRRSNSELR